MSEQDSQTLNWNAAQSVTFGLPSLVPAALKLLRFLAEVERHRCLYQGPAVSRAIQRYENCWFPLLAQCGSEAALQPPLDCEWIWHCHRLNPIVYARDCKLLYGRILDTVSMAGINAEARQRTQVLWEERFPQEKYDLDLSQFHYDDQWMPPARARNLRKIDYNLEEAVMRQKTFYYQVSQPHMKDDSFLKAAEQRYKGFLHLFKMTESKVFLVPTYDIDLMWHAHQLNPEAYARDTILILGRVLEHDDTDSDRGPGHKLDEGFYQTCTRWQQAYGTSYERAGAMYRGEPPLPIHLPPQSSSSSSLSHNTSLVTPLVTPLGTPLDFTPIAPREVMQVSVRVVRAQNLPKKHGELRVRLTVGEKCSSFKLETPSIPLSSKSGWNHTWTFQAERSTQSFGLVLLRRHQSSCVQMLSGSEVLGEVYLKWDSLLRTPTLSYDGLLQLLPPFTAYATNVKPSLLVFVSLTPPQPAPQLFRTINCVPTDDRGHMGMGNFFDRRGCWLTRTVLDHANRQVFIIRTRYSDGNTRTPESEKCIYIHQGGWEYRKSSSTRGTAPAIVIAIAKQVVTTLSMERCWGFFDNTTQLVVRRSMADPLWNIRPLLELCGNLCNQIGLFCGRKLQYEVKGAKEEEEGGFVTLVRYGLPDAPLGKATALFNWRTGAMEVSPEESVVLVLLFSSIISMSVTTIEGQKIRFNSRRQPPNREAKTSDEWGSVVLTTRDRSSVRDSRAMAPYYCWWDMSPLIWSTTFYNPGNAMFGASGCGAAGSCGGGACGGSACGGGCGGGSSSTQVWVVV